MLWVLLKICNLNSFLCPKISPSKSRVSFFPVLFTYLRALLLPPYPISNSISFCHHTTWRSRLIKVSVISEECSTWQPPWKWVCCIETALIWFGKPCVLLPHIGQEPMWIVNPAPLGLYTSRLHTGKLTFIINPAACLSFEVFIIHDSLWVYCIPGSIEQGCWAT